MSRAQLTSTVEQNTGGAVAPFVAGKNKIINGDFGIWQRGTSFTTNYAYTADRFIPYFAGAGASQTISQQTLTPGSISNYESQYFMRNIVVAGTDTTNNQNTIIQYIENVQTLTGQVTVSFWAKANSGTPKIGVGLQQNFGSGGSAGILLNGQSATISTSWARYSFTFALPSISGKTIGAGSSIASVLYFSAGSVNATYAGFNALQSNTFDIWGWQVEAGSVATPFTTATGTLSGELAACQRYFYIKNGANGASGTSEMIGLGTFYNSTIFRCPLQFPVQMRTAPSFVSANSANYFQILGNSTNNQYSTVTLDYSTPTACDLNVTVSGATGGQSAWLQTNSGSAFLQFSAEL